MSLASSRYYALADQLHHYQGAVRGYWLRQAPDPEAVPSAGSAPSAPAEQDAAALLAAHGLAAYQGAPTEGPVTRI